VTSVSSVCTSVWETGIWVEPGVVASVEDCTRICAVAEYSSGWLSENVKLTPPARSVKTITHQRRRRTVSR
jgi:hypothetical protein